MSSKLKDARWAMALDAAHSIGLDFEHFTYEGFDILLGEAQRFLDKNPDQVDPWAQRFGESR